jgi:hypothetical protein
MPIHGEFPWGIKIIRGFRGVNSANRWQKARDGLGAYPAMSVGSVIFARQGDMDEKNDR